MNIHLCHQIPAPIALIYPYFSDLMAFGRLHPIIKKVEKEADNLYRLYETVYLLGLFKHSFSYLSSIESATLNQEVIMTAQPQKNLSIRIRIVFKELNTQETEIQEFIEIKGGFIQKKICEYFITRAHKKVIENIRKELLEPIPKF